MCVCAYVTRFACSYAYVCMCVCVCVEPGENRHCARACYFVASHLAMEGNTHDCPSLPNRADPYIHARTHPFTYMHAHTRVHRNRQAKISSLALVEHPMPLRAYVPTMPLSPSTALMTTFSAVVCCMRAGRSKLRLLEKEGTSPICMPMPKPIAANISLPPPPSPLLPLPSLLLLLLLMWLPSSWLASRNSCMEGLMKSAMGTSEETAKEGEDEACE